MTERRGRDTSAASFGQAAYNRVLQKVEDGHAAITSRMEALFDRMNERLDRVEHDLAAQHQDRDGVQQELRELKRELGELRDATATAGPKLVPTFSAFMWKTVWGKIVALAVGFTAIVVALNNVPDAARKWDAFWVFVRGDERAAVAKQDTTDGR